MGFPSSRPSSSPARRLAVVLIRFYQRAVSPYLGPCCRFTPSCSEYAIGSIGLNGVVVGVVDGFCRILRCNPFNRGGFDPPRRRQL